MKYYASVAGREREVELTEEGIRLDGRAVRAELARLPGRPERHLLLGLRGVLFTARRVEGGWTLELGGRRIQVQVEDERSRTLRELAGGGARTVAGAEIRAPMPGLVLRVLVEPGQPVEAGAPLVVVEAMKMENELRAPAAGRVAEVEVEEGQTVNPQDLLVSFHPPTEDPEDVEKEGE